MQFTQAIAQLLDYPLGWTLALPRDVTIVLVAFFTSLLLTLIRKFTTNQDRMRRCKQDLARLKGVLKQHRAAGDKAAVARTRATNTAVKLIQIKAEGLGLLVSLIPVGALALWAVERLDYLPARAGEEVGVTAHYAPSAIDSVTHLVPMDGLALRSPAVQMVAADPADGSQGIASWRVVPLGNALRGVPSQTENLGNPSGGEAQFQLAIRHDRQTAEQPLRVEGRFYDPPWRTHQGGSIVATEVGLRQAKFLGIVPGIALLGLAPWLVAYLIVAIPLTPLVRYILRVS